MNKDLPICGKVNAKKEHRKKHLLAKHHLYQERIEVTKEQEEVMNVANIGLVDLAEIC